VVILTDAAIAAKPIIVRQTPAKVDERLRLPRGFNEGVVALRSFFNAPPPLVSPTQSTPR
jgi:hypothetical protein